MQADEEEEEAEDYVEEKTTKDGTHIRKEVHQGPGFKSVRITSDGGSGGEIPAMFGGGGGGIPDMMAAMMASMAAGGGPPGFGPPPGMVIRRRISMPMPMIDDDDDDDEGIPPEIMDLIRMTSMMNSRSMGGPMMGGPQIRITKRVVNESHDDDIPHDHAIEISQPRHEESTEDIIAKMNKLSEEISDKHEKRRNYEIVDSKSQRLFQILMIGGVMILAMVLSFAMTCKNYGKEERVEEEQQPATRPVRKAD